MDAASLIAFTAVFAVACSSPGPAIAALIARVLSRGRRGALPFCAGLLLGDLAWLAAAVFGLAALAELFQPLFLAIKYLGAAYLAWLGWRLFTAPAEAPKDLPLAPGEGGRLLFAGLSITLGNPKAMLFFLALLPTVLDLSALTLSGFATLSAVVTLVYSLVLLAYVLLADRARGFIRSSRAMRWMNRVTGGIMLGAAAAVATR